MRVTKIIREYIEETVNNAIPVQGLCPEYTELRQKANEKTVEIENKLKEYGKKLCDEARADLGMPDDWEMKARISYVECNDWNSKLKIKDSELRSAAEKRRGKAIQEILLGMELGEVNRKTLDEAIANAVK